ncbi:hypothetical protein PHYSODRAFT_340847 [Phytophthora sojae]|uniref:Uncharacterized protein n=1 Tax=Phytophthora sojae (strain P6497) TaxID=1094619 RepID=G5ACV1_PHYSP|nr:hypothetical protein PHYSODRAFT_340847 [Phytophthora sojae]EGZ06613.1 hypothetical protein PHYSODRAFT_340847 [Phytophthora sojae]|eukprot:XP_009537377.1 hypothetical protein PHYSODRAFT_340847 [Phytophthora sojae]
MDTFDSIGAATTCENRDEAFYVVAGCMRWLIGGRVATAGGLLVGKARIGIEAFYAVAATGGGLLVGKVRIGIEAFYAVADIGAIARGRVATAGGLLVGKARIGIEAFYAVADIGAIARGRAATAGGLLVGKARIGTEAFYAAAWDGSSDASGHGDTTGALIYGQRDIGAIARGRVATAGGLLVGKARIGIEAFYAAACDGSSDASGHGDTIAALIYGQRDIGAIARGRVATAGGLLVGKARIGTEAFYAVAGCMRWLAAWDGSSDASGHGDTIAALIYGQRDIGAIARGRVATAGGLLVGKARIGTEAFYAVAGCMRWLAACDGSSDASGHGDTIAALIYGQRDIGAIARGRVATGGGLLVGKARIGTEAFYAVAGCMRWLPLLVGKARIGIEAFYAVAGCAACDGSSDASGHGDTIAALIYGQRDIGAIARGRVATGGGLLVGKARIGIEAFYAVAGCAACDGSSDASGHGDTIGALIYGQRDIGAIARGRVATAGGLLVGKARIGIEAFYAVAGCGSCSHWWWAAGGQGENRDEAFYAVAGYMRWLIGCAAWDGSSDASGHGDTTGALIYGQRDIGAIARGRVATAGGLLVGKARIGTRPSTRLQAACDGSSDASGHGDTIAALIYGQRDIGAIARGRVATGGGLLVGKARIGTEAFYAIAGCMRWLPLLVGKARIGIEAFYAVAGCAACDGSSDASGHGDTIAALIYGQRDIGAIARGRVATAGGLLVGKARIGIEAFYAVAGCAACDGSSDASGHGDTIAALIYGQRDIGAIARGRVATAGGLLVGKARTGIEAFYAVAGCAACDGSSDASGHGDTIGDLIYGQRDIGAIARGRVATGGGLLVGKAACDGSSDASGHGDTIAALIYGQRDIGAIARGRVATAGGLLVGKARIGTEAFYAVAGCMRWLIGCAACDDSSDASGHGDTIGALIYGQRDIGAIARGRVATAGGLLVGKARIGTEAFYAVAGCMRWLGSCSHCWWAAGGQGENRDEAFYAVAGCGSCSHWWWAAGGQGENWDEAFYAVAGYMRWLIGCAACDDSSDASGHGDTIGALIYGQRDIGAIARGRVATAGGLLAACDGSSDASGHGDTIAALIYGQRDIGAIARGRVATGGGLLVGKARIGIEAFYAVAGCAACDGSSDASGHGDTIAALIYGQRDIGAIARGRVATGGGLLVGKARIGTEAFYAVAGCAACDGSSDASGHGDTIAALIYGQRDIGAIARGRVATAGGLLVGKARIGTEAFYAVAGCMRWLAACDGSSDASGHGDTIAALIYGQRDIGAIARGRVATAGGLLVGKARIGTEAFYAVAGCAACDGSSDASGHGDTIGALIYGQRDIGAIARGRVATAGGLLVGKVRIGIEAFYAVAGCAACDGSSDASGHGDTIAALIYGQRDIGAIARGRVATAGGLLVGKARIGTEAFYAVAGCARIGTEAFYAVAGCMRWLVGCPLVVGKVRIGTRPSTRLQATCDGSSDASGHGDTIAALIYGQRDIGAIARGRVATGGGLLVGKATCDGSSDASGHGDTIAALIYGQRDIGAIARGRVATAGGLLVGKARIGTEAFYAVAGCMRWLAACDGSSDASGHGDTIAALIYGQRDIGAIARGRVATGGGLLVGKARIGIEAFYAVAGCATCDGSSDASGHGDTIAALIYGQRDIGAIARGRVATGGGLLVGKAACDGTSYASGHGNTIAALIYGQRDIGAIARGRVATGGGLLVGKAACDGSSDASGHGDTIGALIYGQRDIGAIARGRVATAGGLLVGKARIGTEAFYAVAGYMRWLIGCAACDASSDASGHGDTTGALIYVQRDIGAIARGRVATAGGLLVGKARIGTEAFYAVAGCMRFLIGCARIGTEAFYAVAGYMRWLIGCGSCSHWWWAAGGQGENRDEAFYAVAGYMRWLIGCAACDGSSDASGHGDTIGALIYGQRDIGAIARGRVATGGGLLVGKARIGTEAFYAVAGYMRWLIGCAACDGSSDASGHGDTTGALIYGQRDIGAIARGRVATAGGLLAACDGSSDASGHGDTIAALIYGQRDIGAIARGRVATGGGLLVGKARIGIEAFYAVAGCAACDGSSDASGHGDTIGALIYGQRDIGAIARGRVATAGGLLVGKVRIGIEAFYAVAGCAACDGSSDASGHGDTIAALIYGQRDIGAIARGRVATAGGLLVGKARIGTEAFYAVAGCAACDGSSDASGHGDTIAALIYGQRDIGAIARGRVATAGGLLVGKVRIGIEAFYAVAGCGSCSHWWWAAGGQGENRDEAFYAVAGYMRWLIGCAACDGSSDASGHGDTIAALIYGQRDIGAIARGRVATAGGLLVGKARIGTEAFYAVAGCAACDGSSDASGHGDTIAALIYGQRDIGAIARGRVATAGGLLVGKVRIGIEAFYAVAGCAACDGSSDASGHGDTIAALIYGQRDIGAIARGRVATAGGLLVGKVRIGIEAFYAVAGCAACDGSSDASGHGDTIGALIYGQRDIGAIARGRVATGGGLLVGKARIGTEAFYAVAGCMRWLAACDGSSDASGHGDTIGALIYGQRDIGAIARGRVATGGGLLVGKARIGTEAFYAVAGCMRWLAACDGSSDASGHGDTIAALIYGQRDIGAIARGRVATAGGLLVGKARIGIEAFYAVADIGAIARGRVATAGGLLVGKARIGIETFYAVAGCAACDGSSDASGHGDTIAALIYGQRDIGAIARGRVATAGGLLAACDGSSDASGHGDTIAALIYGQRDIGAIARGRVATAGGLLVGKARIGIEAFYAVADIGAIARGRVATAGGLLVGKARIGTEAFYAVAGYMRWLAACDGSSDASGHGDTIAALIYGQRDIGAIARGRVATAGGLLVGKVRIGIEAFYAVAGCAACDGSSDASGHGDTIAALIYGQRDIGAIARGRVATAGGLLVGKVRIGIEAFYAVAGCAACDGSSDASGHGDTIAALIYGQRDIGAIARGRVATAGGLLVGKVRIGIEAFYAVAGCAACDGSSDASGHGDTIAALIYGQRDIGAIARGRVATAGGLLVGKAACDGTSYASGHGDTIGALIYGQRDIGAIARGRVATGGGLLVGKARIGTEAFYAVAGCMRWLARIGIEAFYAVADIGAIARGRVATAGGLLVGKAACDGTSYASGHGDTIGALIYGQRDIGAIARGRVATGGGLLVGKARIGTEAFYATLVPRVATAGGLLVGKAACDGTSYASGHGDTVGALIYGQRDIGAIARGRVATGGGLLVGKARIGIEAFYAVAGCARIGIEAFYAVADIGAIARGRVATAGGLLVGKVRIGIEAFYAVAGCAACDGSSDASGHGDTIAALIYGQRDIGAIARGRVATAGGLLVGKARIGIEAFYAVAGENRDEAFYAVAGCMRWLIGGRVATAGGLLVGKVRIGIEAFYAVAGCAACDGSSDASGHGDTIAALIYGQRDIGAIARGRVATGGGLLVGKARIGIEAFYAVAGCVRWGRVATAGGLLVGKAACDGSSDASGHGDTIAALIYGQRDIGAIARGRVATGGGLLVGKARIGIEAFYAVAGCAACDGSSDASGHGDTIGALIYGQRDIGAIARGRVATGGGLLVGKARIGTEAFYAVAGCMRWLAACDGSSDASGHGDTIAALIYGQRDIGAIARGRVATAGGLLVGKAACDGSSDASGHGDTICALIYGQRDIGAIARGRVATAGGLLVGKARIGIEAFYAVAGENRDEAFYAVAGCMRWLIGGRVATAGGLLVGKARIGIEAFYAVAGENRDEAFYAVAGCMRWLIGGRVATAGGLLVGKARIGIEAFYAVAGENRDEAFYAVAGCMRWLIGGRVATAGGLLVGKARIGIEAFYAVAGENRDEAFYAVAGCMRWLIGHCWWAAGGQGENQDEAFYAVAGCMRWLIGGRVATAGGLLVGKARIGIEAFYAVAATAGGLLVGKARIGTRPSTRLQAACDGSPDASGHGDTIGALIYGQRDIGAIARGRVATAGGLLVGKARIGIEAFYAVAATAGGLLVGKARIATAGGLLVGKARIGTEAFYAVAGCMRWLIGCPLLVGGLLVGKARIGTEAFYAVAGWGSCSHCWWAAGGLLVGKARIGTEAFYTVAGCMRWLIGCPLLVGCWWARRESGPRPSTRLQAACDGSSDASGHGDTTGALIYGQRDIATAGGLLVGKARIGTEAFYAVAGCMRWLIGCGSCSHCWWAAGGLLVGKARIGTEAFYAVAGCMRWLIGCARIGTEAFYAVAGCMRWHSICPLLVLLVGKARIGTEAFYAVAGCMRWLIGCARIGTEAFYAVAGCMRWLIGCGSCSHCWWAAGGLLVGKARIGTEAFYAVAGCMRWLIGCPLLVGCWWARRESGPRPSTRLQAACDGTAYASGHGDTTGALIYGQRDIGAIARGRVATAGGLLVGKARIGTEAFYAVAGWVGWLIGCPLLVGCWWAAGGQGENRNRGLLRGCRLHAMARRMPTAGGLLVGKARIGTEAFYAVAGCMRWLIGCARIGTEAFYAVAGCMRWLVGWGSCSHCWWAAGGLLVGKARIGTEAFYAVAGCMRWLPLLVGCWWAAGGLLVGKARIGTEAFYAVAGCMRWLVGCPLLVGCWWARRESGPRPSTRLQAACDGSSDASGHGDTTGALIYGQRDIATAGGLLVGKARIGTEAFYAVAGCMRWLGSCSHCWWAAGGLLVGKARIGTEAFYAVAGCMRWLVGCPLLVGCWWAAGGLLVGKARIGTEAFYAAACDGSSDASGHGDTTGAIIYGQRDIGAIAWGRVATAGGLLVGKARIGTEAFYAGSCSHCWWAAGGLLVGKARIGTEAFYAGRVATAGGLLVGKARIGTEAFYAVAGCMRWLPLLVGKARIGTRPSTRLQAAWGGSSDASGHGDTTGALIYGQRDIGAIARGRVATAGGQGENRDEAFYAVAGCVGWLIGCVWPWRYRVRSKRPPTNHSFLKLLDGALEQEEARRLAGQDQGAQAFQV